MPYHARMLRASSAGAILIFAAGSCVLTACMPKGPGGLDSPLAQDRMEAAVDAGEHRDTRSVPGLVVLLGSDDPAVRMVSIHALRDITGVDLGYDYAASEEQREEAIRRWETWVHEHAPAATAEPNGSTRT